MSFNEHLNQVKRLHYLIKRKATGNAQQLAKRLEVSRATVFRRIEDLKTLGAEVEYCKERQSYFYRNYFELVL